MKFKDRKFNLMARSRYSPISKAVKKPKKDPIREDRIHDQAIVDAYGPEEQAMSWYYYLDDKIRFPFQAKCIAPKSSRRSAREALSKCGVWRRKTPAPPTCSC